MGGCGHAGTRARSPPRGLVGIRVGGGSGASAGCGLTSRVGRGAWTLLVDPGAFLVWSGVLCGPGVRALKGGRGTLCHESGGGGIGDGGGAPCWALLLPGLGWLGPEVVEDVLGGSSSRCGRGAGLGLGLGFGCRLRPWCADGFQWLLAGGLGLMPGCRRGLRWGVGLGGGGIPRGGDRFRDRFGRLSPGLRGWCAGQGRGGRGG